MKLITQKPVFVAYIGPDLETVKRVLKDVGEEVGSLSLFQTLKEVDDNVGLSEGDIVATFTIQSLHKVKKIGVQLEEINE